MNLSTSLDVQNQSRGTWGYKRLTTTTSTRVKKKKKKNSTG
jgi:hypothetical protein